MQKAKMSVALNCKRPLTVQQTAGGTLSISTDESTVVIYNYPRGYVQEISFRSHTNSPEYENSNRNDPSDCSIRIEFVQGYEYIFKYPTDLLHHAFADFVILRSILKSYMEPIRT